MKRLASWSKLISWNYRFQQFRALFTALHKSTCKSILCQKSQQNHHDIPITADSRGLVRESFPSVIEISAVSSSSSSSSAPTSSALSLNNFSCFPNILSYQRSQATATNKISPRIHPCTKLSHKNKQALVATCSTTTIGPEGAQGKASQCQLPPPMPSTHFSIQFIMHLNSHLEHCQLLKSNKY